LYCWRKESKISRLSICRPCVNFKKKMIIIIIIKIKN